MKTPLLTVNNLSKRYDSRSPAGVSSISFHLNAGECVSLIGPSGSGKSTTLNLIKQKIIADKGGIEFFGSSMAYVPQVNVLNPSLTIFQNIEEEIKNIKDDEKRINQVRTTLQTLELTNEIHKLPNEVSGGQLQRVVIAKALVHNPDLIMLDEPFAHLDQRLRFELMQELFYLFDDKKIAVLWVTHEVHEALAFSQRVIVLNQGKIEQIGTPEDIYQRPSSMFVASFFGNANLIAGKLISETNDEIIVNAMGREVVLKRPQLFKPKEHGDVLLVVRPESIYLDPTGNYQGKVESIQYYGPYYLVKVKEKHQHLWVQIDNHVKLKIAQKIKFNMSYNKVYCLDEI
jgi:iron(III) transport system ATP-binding protein